MHSRFLITAVHYTKGCVLKIVPQTSYQDKVLGTNLDLGGEESGMNVWFKQHTWNMFLKPNFFHGEITSSARFLHPAQE